jgi:disulfide oxidoreductase YuzD
MPQPQIAITQYKSGDNTKTVVTLPTAEETAEWLVAVITATESALERQRNSGDGTG